ncbi:hypothetical protein G7K_4438-t1 [Saitoella complicata NRRL Y-17804]|uniref:Uncharacterized protein n=1 Tax=Saitoella complicata (strain BCRC 22490 / CBS 7301 / JCM 7358 / NBRC 10748 / NRRL Y-17804) TaxID=698492 RepID=A0A0E9NKG8_SAICN|nr:hypothetical protein G7K_4438-t1 [Saitoella complicata NRRL Y-17804]
MPRSKMQNSNSKHIEPKKLQQSQKSPRRPEVTSHTHARTPFHPDLFCRLSGSLSLGGAGLLGLTLLEAVLEATVDVLQVGHATGTSGLSALALVRPVDYTRC